MEIKFDPNAAKASKIRPIPTAAAAERASKPAVERVEFREAAAVDKALQATPDVRTDEVARARQLVGDVTYPPRETIQKIASLLAMKFSSE